MTIGKAGKIGVFRLLENDDLIESVKKKAQESNIRAGAFILIGSIKHAVLGYYRDGEYKNTKFEGPLEVASCTGNVAVDEKGEAVVHAHVVVVRRGHESGESGCKQEENQDARNKDRVLEIEIRLPLVFIVGNCRDDYCYE